VKNYTGDRLHFGLAAEQARADGFQVEIVVVADDCSLDDKRSKIGKRGLAGTVFVHKVAGAAAEAGLSLEEVVREAKAAAENVTTIGLSLTTCAIPGKKVHSERIGIDEVELGLGIHGEPGASKVKLQSADSLVDALLASLLQSVKKLPEWDFNNHHSPGNNTMALMINNLGSTTDMEMLVVARKAIESLAILPTFRVTRLLIGRFMTSLNMQGVSLSLLLLTSQREKRLDSDTEAPAWIKPTKPLLGCPIVAPTETEAPKEEEPKLFQFRGESEKDLVFGAIASACRTIIEMEPQLTEWDAMTGDGDCGMTLKRGAEQLLARLQSCSEGIVSAISVLRIMGDTFETSMGGTSGALYSIMAHGAIAGLKRRTENQIKTMTVAEIWSEALSSAVGAVLKYGGAPEKSRTMNDALVPAERALRLKLKEGATSLDALQVAAKEARKGAEETKTERATAGRASYVPDEVLRGTPDPGAMAIAALFEAILAHLSSHHQ